MMSDGNRSALAIIVSTARQLVAADGRGNCFLCDHDVDVCDCGLSKLRHAVLAWDESTQAPGVTPGNASKEKP